MLAERLVPLKAFATQYKNLGTESKFRRWIRENTRGFSKCVVRCGNQRYYIDLNAFDVWLEEQRVSQQERK